MTAVGIKSFFNISHSQILILIVELRNGLKTVRKPNLLLFIIHWIPFIAPAMFIVPTFLRTIKLIFLSDKKECLHNDYTRL